MLPAIRLNKSVEGDVRAGMPWIYAGDLVDSSAHRLISPGSLVAIETARGDRIGTGYFNALSPIACRVLTLKNEPIDQAFFVARMEKALALREKKIGTPYCRLIHSEADGLPGLLVDRFGEDVVVQVGTTGMERLQPMWMSALKEIISPQRVIVRNDSAARKLEGLEVAAPLEESYIVQLQENGCLYLADLARGQKTGWFYDQRDNRRMIADLARDKTLLDVFSHSGGFALLAAGEGARAVTLVDSSALALDLARQAAARNGIEAMCETIKGDAAETMQALAGQGRRFDIVLVDPPAYVKAKKDIAAGMKAYEKLARLGAALVAPGGHLFMASCSHHATRTRFREAVLSGVRRAGLAAVILKETGASADHPKHPKLPQSEYLKGVLLKISGQE